MSGEAEARRILNDSHKLARDQLRWAKYYKLCGCDEMREVSLYMARLHITCALLMIKRLRVARRNHVD